MNNFGVNIFSFRNDLEKNEDLTFKKISEIGISFIEPWINIGQEFDNPRHKKNQTWKLKDVDEKISMIKKYGLDVHTAFMFFCEYDGKVLARDIQFLHDKYGIEGFVFMDTHLKDKEKADLLCNTINIISQNISDDISLLYHNHDNEYEYTINNQPIMEYMLDKCPRLCLEADLAWLHYVGRNPSKYLEKYKNRVKMLHLQDLSEGYIYKDKDKMTCAVGTGVVDLKTTMKEMSKYPLIESCRFIVDQDYCHDDMYKDIVIGMKYIEENINS